MRAPGWRAAARRSIETFDLRALDDAFYWDPYPTYRMLRETRPVLRLPDGSLFLTRHADLADVYRDPVLFSSDKVQEFGAKYGPGTPLFAHHTGSLVFNDAPRHTQVRRLIAGALTARAVSALEPGLVALVDALLDGMAARGRCDAIEDYAAAIPVEVIGNLLAVPRADRGPLRHWSLAILGALEPSLTPEQEQRGHDAVTGFLEYLRGLVAERRRHPGDPARDVLTRLVQGEREDGTGRLDEAELLQNCIFILNAGHETTTNLIGNALALLLDWPDARARLLADPALVRPAVEEFLRFESSNQLGSRMATAPTRIGEEEVAAGTPITLCIGAANRDPAAFDDPERLDVTRWPNRHLAFGLGVHQCAGLAVARLEATVAIGRFLARFPRYAAAGPRVRSRRARFRGLVTLPLALE